MPEWQSQLKMKRTPLQQLWLCRWESTQHIHGADWESRAHSGARILCHGQQHHIPKSEEGHSSTKFADCMWSYDRVMKAVQEHVKPALVKRYEFDNRVRKLPPENVADMSPL